MQAENLEVVADVADRGDLLGPGRPGERIDAARAAETPAERRLSSPRARGRPGQGPRRREDAAWRPCSRPKSERGSCVDMLERVLAACAGAESITGTLLVTPDPGFAPRASRSFGTRARGTRRQSPSRFGDERASGGVLVVMADCPLVAPGIPRRARRRRPPARPRPVAGRRRERARPPRGQRLRARRSASRSRRPSAPRARPGSSRRSSTIRCSRWTWTGPRTTRRCSRAADHLLAEGLHPADEALPRRLPLLHVRAAAAPRRARVHDARTRCSTSRARARRPAATRRSSRSATSPSCRYRAAREELAELGCETTIEYLARMCELVLAETGLLPHANPGVMTRDELAALRTVSASQGIMLETASERLSQRGGPHFGSPDKLPERAAGDDRASPASSRSRSPPGS